MIRSRFKPVFGVCINDADYEVQINETLGYDSKGKQIVKMIWKCPYHSKWLGMVTRAYYANYKKRKTTYEDCNTVDEWRYFMNFRRWMEEQDWEGKELDKDLIQYENKIYGPDTCVFVPAYINGILFSGSKSPTRNLPLGVYEDRKNFMAKCHNEGVQKYLGSYKNLFDAHSAWQKEKIITIESKIERYKKESFANRTVVNNLYKIVDNLQKDFENNCITEKLYY